MSEQSASASRIIPFLELEYSVDPKMHVLSAVNDLRALFYPAEYLRTRVRVSGSGLVIFMELDDSMTVPEEAA